MRKKINKKLYYYLIPFLMGIFSSFSLPPYNFILINFLTFPILLFFLIEVKKKYNSILLNFNIGWIFGVGYFLSNIYWIVYSLTFEDIFKPFIPLALFLIPTFLGLFYGFATLIISIFNLKKDIQTILIFSLFFSILEFCRGFILGGFPWNLIAYSWTNHINSLQILSVIGTYTFNLLSITLFVFPLFFFSKKSLKIKYSLILFLFFLIIFNNFYGTQKIEKNSNLNKKFINLNIKIISPKISIDRFFKENNEKKIISELIELTKADFNKKTIFVFPEGALAGIDFNYLQNFKEIFKKNFSNKHRIIMGINTEEKINNSIKSYNSLVVLDNNLNLIKKYNKNKLVPFGEFLPLESFLKKVGLKKVTKGYKSFNAGDYRETLFVDNSNFNFIPLICYEIIYSGRISKFSDDTNFIINISEDGWFGNSVGPHQHFSHTIFRAIEEGKNIIRSSNNGISAYIDSNGIIKGKLESTQRGVINITNYKDLNKTIFSSQGNKMFFYFVLIYIILIFFFVKKSFNERKL